MDLNFVDILLLAFLAFGLVRGFIKGLVHQLASLVAILVGIWVAFHYSDIVSEWLAPYFENHEGWLKITSYVLIFIAVGLAMWLLAKFLTGLLKMVFLGMVNRILGAAFGLLKSLLILLLVTHLGQSFLVHFAKDSTMLDDSVVFQKLWPWSEKAGDYFTEWRVEYGNRFE